MHDAIDKLDETRFFLAKLREPQPWQHFRYHLSAFLSAARSVDNYVAHRHKKDPRFKAWDAEKRRRIGEFGELLFNARGRFVHRSAALHVLAIWRRPEYEGESVMEVYPAGVGFGGIEQPRRIMAIVVPAEVPPEEQQPYLHRRAAMIRRSDPTDLCVAFTDELDPEPIDELLAKLTAFTEALATTVENAIGLFRVEPAPPADP